MYREICRQDALKRLLNNEKVYMIRETDMRLADLDESLDQRLIADVDDEIDHSNDVTCFDYELVSRENQVMGASDINDSSDNCEQKASKKQVKSVEDIFKAEVKHHNMTLEPKICALCGKEFMGSGTKKYCSDECAREARNAKMKQYKIDQGITIGTERECPICGKTFHASGNQKYCSNDCRKEAMKPTYPHEIKHVCAQCGKEFVGGPAAKRCPECRGKKKTGPSRLDEWGVDYGKKQAEETLTMVTPIAK